MVILDKMILSRRLTEFVCEVLKIRNEEMIDKARWEVWLHKIFDMEFGEYLSKLDGGASVEEIPQDEILEVTVRESWGIINDFCPS
jgi:hypothetical protein